jgi:hypothetical protein
VEGVPDLDGADEPDGVHPVECDEASGRST